MTGEMGAFKCFGADSAGEMGPKEAKPAVKEPRALTRFPVRKWVSTPSSVTMTDVEPEAAAVKSQVCSPSGGDW